MAFCSCFGPSKAERREADLAESEEARAKAAEAAQRRQEQGTCSQVANGLSFRFLWILIWKDDRKFTGRSSRNLIKSEKLKSTEAVA
ncbi:hypothetical protein OPV22_006807 [Ensete ventricosum]|uniref:Casein kinase substrate phosphoprotein PP28 domain-containing protein n=1 Tax=Ensete ventricosum TaxID=4639 RepID=A0AAV8RSG0_ENSVE|nr:hypothetical protein OPV22_006807 [Ensete ventricosum]